MIDIYEMDLPKLKIHNQEARAMAISVPYRPHHRELPDGLDCRQRHCLSLNKQIDIGTFCPFHIACYTSNGDMVK